MRGDHCFRGRHDNHHVFDGNLQLVTVVKVLIYDF